MTSTGALIPDDFPRALPPEPFGSRMRRARKLAGITLDEAAEKISIVWPVSGATISRLENNGETVPIDASQRILAGIAVMIYGVLPSDVGVDLGDVPPNILAQLRDKIAQTCFDGPSSLIDQPVLLDSDLQPMFDFTVPANVVPLRRAS